ncbi:MAG: hypothetical protein DWH91_07685 [Planctomycetota bacterium]|nr:MAG: hypothetical protein DWH91_07685 [Planctomycetota bacterium]
MHKLALALVLVFAASPVIAQDAAAEKITYNDHILPLFKAKCGSCHNANDRKGGLTLDNYAGTMQGGSSGTVVEGGDAGNSYLWNLITHESEPKMPPNADKMPEAELALVKKWIDGGLLESSGSTAKMKKKSSLAKIEVSTERPAEVAMPIAYLGDPVVQSPTRNAVTALAVSPWAPLAAISGHRQITLYHTQTFEVLGVLPFPEGQPQVLKFSRNGAMLMAGGGRGGASGKVVVYDVKTGERTAEIGDEYDSVLAADISADQTMIALGGPKKMIRVYSIESGELLFESKKHTDWITAIEFSPDGVLLASGDRSNGLVVWESSTGKEFYNLLGHQGMITDISWRPDSNVVASASEDNTIRLWEMTNGTEVKKWNAHGGCLAMDYIRDGRLVSNGRDRVVRLWNGDGGQLKEFPGQGDLGMEVAFDAESERVLGGDWLGMIRIWNAADGALLNEFNTNPPTIDATIAQAEQLLGGASGELTQATNQIAAVNKVLADRKALADTAAAQLNEITTKAQAAAAEKAAMEKALAEKTVEMTKAIESLKAAEAALAAAKAAFEKANAEQAAATTGKKTTEELTAAAKAATEKSAAAEKLLLEEMAKSKATADKAAAEAPAKPEEQKALTDYDAAAKIAQQKAEAAKAKLDRLKALKAAPKPMPVVPPAEPAAAPATPPAP